MQAAVANHEAVPDMDLLGILRTGYPPQAVDVPRLLEHISFADADISALNSQILERRAHIAQIMEEITVLSAQGELRARQVLPYRSVFAPVRRLPMEILTEIFVHCLPDPSAFGYPEARRTLMHVCSSWRELVCSTPRLWSTILVNGPNDAEASLEHMNACLARSGTHPLNIFVTHLEGSPASSEILSRLARHAHHWRSMELVVGDVELLQLFSLVDGAGLQMLQRFDLDIIQASGTAATRRILNGLNFLFHAPRLHDVQISSNMQDMAIPDLPWSQLTRLDLRLSPLSTSHILDILSKSPNLTDFSTIITAYLNPLETVTIQPLVHANLKYLNLVISTNFRHLFSRLTLPSLERLRVHCRTHISRGESDWGNLSSFLRRSAPPLDQLNLLLYWIPESDLLDCLTYVPSLTRFHCTADVQIDHILKAMTISSKSKTDSHPVVLPRLDTLILRGPTFAPQSLTDMVLSRYGDTFSSPSSLRQVRLDVADEIEELEISTRLAPLRELGLGLFLWP